MVEFDFPELLHDARDRTLPWRKRFDTKNSRRNYDLTITKVGSEDVGHVVVAQTRCEVPGKIDVKFVVELISRLHDTRLDPWSIHASDESPGASRSAATLRVRRCLHFTGAHPAGRGIHDQRKTIQIKKREI